MNYLYFGLISSLFKKLFQWIYDTIWNSILKPIVSWLADLFSKLFEPIYNSLLKPILKELLDIFIDLIGSTITDFIHEPLFQLHQFLLKIVDGLGEIFELLAGRGKVVFSDGTSDNIVKGLVLRPGVKNAFVSFFFIGLLLLGLFTVLALFKSNFNVGNNGESPTTSKVMHSFGKSIMTLASGPMLVLCFLLFSVSLVNMTIDVVSTRDGGERGQITYGSALFVASTISWSNDIDANGEYKTSFKEAKRNNYLYTPKSYDRDFKTVKEDLGITIPNTIVGIILVFMAVFPMIGICYALIVRVLDIIILFLIFPFFAATIPLDEGEKYKRWKEMLIARVFVANGTVLMFVVTLYLYIPWAVNLHISLGSKLAVWLMRMVMIVASVKAIDSFPKLAQGLFSYEGASIDVGYISVGKNTVKQLFDKGVEAVKAYATGGASAGGSSVGSSGSGGLGGSGSGFGGSGGGLGGGGRGSGGSGFGGSRSSFSGSGSNSSGNSEDQSGPNESKDNSTFMGNVLNSVQKSMKHANRSMDDFDDDSQNSKNNIMEINNETSSA